MSPVEMAATCWKCDKSRRGDCTAEPTTVRVAARILARSCPLLRFGVPMVPEWEKKIWREVNGLNRGCRGCGDSPLIIE